MTLYPLKFKPLLLEKIWGGRKLETLLHQPLPPAKLIGESWQLYDFPPHTLDPNQSTWISSEIANGPLAGQTLHDLITNHAPALYGPPRSTPNQSAASNSPATQFPLLIKFLDARQDLSVQVHPPQPYCDKNPNAHLKSEAWYVIQSDPNARILKGLKPHTTRRQFENAIATNTVESLIESIPVKPGHCHYLPSGTVHALGAGILAAEVQTPSDTTFRLHDFNRLEPSTGQPRALHIPQALDCIDFTGQSTEPPQLRSHTAGYFTTVSRLVTSPYFTMEKVRMSEGIEEPLPYTHPTIWIFLEGSAQITVDDLQTPVPLSPGQTTLLPAQMQNPKLKTLSDSIWLEVTFPTPRPLA